MSISTNYFPETKVKRSSEENTWLRQGKALTELALPFISLYKPAGTALSYGVGVLSVTQSTTALIFGKSEKRAENALAVAKGVADLSTAYFQSRGMLIVNSMFELMQGVYNLYLAPRNEKIAQLGKCLSISINLLSVVHQNSLQWKIISLVFQALTHFYQANQTFQTEEKPENLKHEKALTIIAKTAMGFIRLYQAHDIYQHIQLIKAAEKWLAETENNDLVTGEPVEEQQAASEEKKDVPEAIPAPEPALIQTEDAPQNDQNPAATSAPAPEENKDITETVASPEPAPAQTVDFLQIDRVSIEKTEEKAPEVPEWVMNHPLKNLAEQIDAKRVVLIDPTTEKKYNFGAYFHGYGKGLVNGANLRFQRKVSKDGAVVTGLSFKINRFYLSRAKEQYENLKITADQIKTLQRSSNATENEKTSTALKDLVAFKVKYSDFFTSYSENYSMTDGKEKTIISMDEERLTLNLKRLLSTDFDSRGIRINGVGSLEMGENTVKVSLQGDQDIGQFHRFLSLFGLDEAIQPSTAEDLEKIKLGFLFKFFYPLQAYQSQKDESFLTLSIDQMKEKIIAMAPQMAKYFNEYNIQPVEMLPGLVRYSIPIDNEVYSLGGRALTAMITSGLDNEGEITSELSKKELRVITNIIKHGMFSEHLKKAGKLSKDGLGGNGSVFTQMIWKEDVAGQKQLEKLGYSGCGHVRLYISLKSLNRGSHQYDSDLGGTKQGSTYKRRKNILDFTRFFPFWSKQAKKCHELMTPDRIFSKEIKGISVNTEQIRDQILNHFRKCQLIQLDAKGKEMINGIPAKEFISVEHHIPADIVKRCGQAETALA